MRAMYNVSLCYSYGEGLVRSQRQGRRWMKRAADRGHSKAQFEHGLGLFSVCSLSIPHKPFTCLSSNTIQQTGKRHVFNSYNSTEPKKRKKIKR